MSTTSMNVSLSESLSSGTDVVLSSALNHTLSDDFLAARAPMYYILG